MRDRARDACVSCNKKETREIRTPVFIVNSAFDTLFERWFVGLIRCPQIDCCKYRFWIALIADGMQCS